MPRRRFAMVLLIVLCAAPATFGAAGTWTGKITDDHCRVSHRDGLPTGGQVLNDPECVKLCIASGAKYMLVTDDGVYSVANQKFKGLGANVAQTVQVEGELDGTTISVSKISPAKKTKKQTTK